MKTIVWLAILFSSYANAQTLAKVGENTAYSLGSLLASKVQDVIQFEDLPETANFYRDIVMIYRSEVIACDGFLDRLDIGIVQKISSSKRIELLSNDVATLDKIRSFDPDLDAKAQSFAKEKFLSVIERFSKGTWPIQPPCLTNRYQPKSVN
jgi:hypothetical protein